MNNPGNEAVLCDQPKPRRAKSREVSSRFLSPNSTSSPNRRNSTSKQQNQTLQDLSSIQGLWQSTKSNSSTKKEKSLPENPGTQKLEDVLDQKSHDQRTCNESNRFEDEMESTKENLRPSLGVSMRYTGKSSSLSCSKKSMLNDDDNSTTLPGRFSVDESALYKTSSRRNSYSFTYESDSEFSDIFSASNLSTNSLVSTRKLGNEVPSKFLHDIQPRRGTSNFNNTTNNSQKANFSSIKKAIKRTNSVVRYGSSTSQWALSPGRSGSPPIPVGNKARPMPFSRLKPPVGSPPRAKGVGKLLNLGFDLFKTKKSSPSSSSPIKLKSCDVKAIHQLKLLHNRLIQWRFANAKADAVNKNLVNQVTLQLLCASDTLTKLEHLVVQERIQLQKRELQMKLYYILQSQIKRLETWEDIERQHLSALSMAKECLHSVICKVPLLKGAKVDVQSASITFGQASDLTDSLESVLTTFSSPVEKFVPFLSELAEVVIQEKLMLEECHELLRTISELEIQERSLKCYILQLEQQQQQVQREQPQKEQKGTSEVKSS